METNAQTKIVTATADVYTVEGSQTPHDTLMFARCEASRVAMRLGHSVKVYKNGKLHSLKRY